jgi:hypothetical protein
MSNLQGCHGFTLFFALPSSLATDRLELTAAARMLCASLVLFV